MDVTTWTRPRSLTFFERIRLMLMLFSMRLGRPDIWLRILWSSGVKGSFDPTGPLTGKLHIESASGNYATLSVRRVRV
jgi:hypothetical protein